jgi:integrase
VPVDLIAFLGRAEIWRSLKTGDHAVAVKRYRRARADLDTWFDQQRRRRDAGERLNGEAPRLAVDWFRQVEHRAAHADYSLTGGLLHEALGETGQELFELVHGGADEEVSAAISRILISAGWPAKPHVVGSISTKRTKFAEGGVPAALPELVRRALVELARRRRDRLQGKPNDGYDPLFSGSSPVQPVSNGQDSAGITLAELIDRFTADKGPRVRAKKMLEYGMLFRVLKELWGEHLPIREIRPDACHRVRDLLAVLPANASKRFRNMSLIQAAEHARTDGIAPMNPATANAYLSRLSTMFKWAVRQWLIERNPAEGLTVAEPEGDPRSARAPFSLDQLKAIFAPPRYSQLKGARRWIPLLALFTGMRLNEICQLTVDDLTTEYGLAVIQVRAGTGKRLKTDNAQRVIPIHEELIRCGLLEFVDRMRRAGHDRLFPELQLDRRGYYSDRYQKWFGRYLDEAGARAPKTSFHSFRHAFTDALRRAGATGEVIDGLLGWSRGDMRGRYGSGPWLGMLAEVMARIEYPGLDLSHLHVR